MSPEHFLTFLNNKIHLEWKISFVATFFVGLMTHIYKLVNFLPNWDSLLNLYTNQNKTELGRCFLQFACGISSYYDLPWVNGILSLIYISLTSVCVCELFRLRNKLSLFFVSGILVSFPTVTSTLAYNYTADGYFLSLLCIAAAILLVDRYWKLWPLASLLIMYCVGIYQAYITFGITLILIYLLDKLLFGKESIDTLWKKGMIFLICGILGNILYYLAEFILLHINHIVLSDYQSLNQSLSLGNISIRYSLFRIHQRFFYYFFNIKEGITLSLVINILSVLIIAGFIMAALIRRWKNHDYKRIFLVLLLIMLLPSGSLALYLIGPDIDYHNLMIMSFSLIYCLPAIWYGKIKDGMYLHAAGKQWFACIVMTFCILNYILIANISYQRMHVAYEKSYRVLCNIADRIERLHEIDACKKIAVFGCLPGSEAYDLDLSVSMTGITNGLIIREQNTQMKENVLRSALADYCDISFEDTTEEDRNKIRMNHAYLEMGVWPAENSVMIIDDTLVIRLGEEKNIE